MKRRIASLFLILCLAITLLPFSVFAADDTIMIGFYYVEDPESHFWNTNFGPGTVKYATTAQDGTLADVTEADNWNIKFEYPASGTPTLTFRGATIKNENGRGLMIKGNTDLNIVVEKDSSIEVGKSSAFEVITTGKVTITGAGKLSVSSKLITMAFCCDGGILMKDLKLVGRSDLKGSGTAIATICVKKGDLTIDHCDLDLDAKGGNNIWMFTKVGPEGELYYEKHYLIQDTMAKNLTIQNGTKIVARADSWNIGASGQILVKDSELELTCGSNSCFGTKPVLEGVIAKGGITSEKLINFNVKKYASFKYLKITPGVEETVDTTNPYTGDTFNIVLVVALVLVSAVALVVLLMFTFKKRKQ